MGTGRSRTWKQRVGGGIRQTHLSSAGNPVCESLRMVLPGSGSVRVITTWWAKSSTRAIEGWHERSASLRCWNRCQDRSRASRGADDKDAEGRDEEAGAVGEWAEEGEWKLGEAGRGHEAVAATFENTPSSQLLNRQSWTIVSPGTSASKRP